MTRPLSSFPACALLCASAASFLSAQAPLPAPPLAPGQREAAAAIEAPRPLAPPPVPGQLQGAAPALPQPQTPGAPAPSPDYLSKMQALEAVTQQPAVQEAPRVGTAADKAPVTISTSKTGQFIVHGKVFETRSAMSSRCEEIAAELRKVLNDKDAFVLPIVVLLNTGVDATKSKGPPISTAITELNHGGFHLQVTVNERAGLNAADLRKEVVRALLAERIVRNQQKIATPEGRLLLPDWVMTGVLHAMDYKATARPSAIFAAIFRSGKIYGIEEIIAASPVEMDGLSRSIYETSCCALVLALVDQVEGPQRFNKFLSSLASDPRSERELLDVAFPKFAASASSLNKWWSLQLAALSRPGIAEPFTAADSLKAIEEAILIRYAAKPDEVPQGVKERPFVLPAPLFVAPPPQPKPVRQPLGAQESEPPATRRLSSSPPASRERETAGPAADAPPAPAGTAEEDTEEKPKSALWRRMLFLGAAKPEDKPAESGAKPETEAPAEPVKEEPKPGFLGRLLGGKDSEKKKPEEKPAEKEEEPKAAETPRPKAESKEEARSKTAAKPKAEPKEDSKPAAGEPPSKLNPLNWFRGGKKPPEEKPAEKDKQTSVLPATELPLARLLAPSLADAWQMLAPAAPRQTVDILGFLKRKPKEEEPKTETAPPPMPAPASLAPKPEASAPRKPRTSNPNSTPAARPRPSPTGGQRTTNPNAKPVPAAAVPAAAAAAATGGAAPAPTTIQASGLVPVTLPLEEYKHVMKRADRAEIFDRNLATLRALDLRVSTLFRPVVLAYLDIITDLKEGKTKDMEKRLATAHQFALVAYQKSIAVRDFVDFYEANESGGLSGKFDDYLNLPAIIQKELPVREDPISKYLDAIDKEFSE